jgi:UDP-GlcNAc:undecaprenyl-phosphate GlcNAc-1-phosphate transferase
MLFVLCFVSSLFLVCLSVPLVFRYAKRWKFLENSGGIRKIHRGQIPHFGGLPIFAALLITTTLFQAGFIANQWLLVGSLLVFTVGLVDDIKSLKAGYKLFVQLIGACLLVLKGGVCIVSLEGILGYAQLAYLPAVIMSILFIVGVVNAFNLIDGIDGLAASLALHVSIFYACLFYKAGLNSLSCLCCSLSGALSAFLFFNLFASRKLLLGDCGSLLIGLLTAFLSIKFLGLPTGKPVAGIFFIHAKIALVVSCLSVPIFDTVRVFVLRIANMRSPFEADENHVHHRLLQLGLSHLQATTLLLFLNMATTAFALFNQILGNTTIIFTVGIMMLLLNGLLTFMLAVARNRSAELSK